MMDITQHKRAEQQRGLLLREFDHRIRNIFSTVSSIISLSAPTAESIEDYATSLRERLFALTAVHDLVRNADHKVTTSLSAVARIVTSRGLADKITADGPDLDMSVQAATSFGMILHELLTNALKHGALSNSEGVVSANWTGRRADAALWQREYAPVGYAVGYDLPRPAVWAATGPSEPSDLPSRPECYLTATHPKFFLALSP